MIKALPRIYSFVSVTWKIIGKKRDNMDSSMFRKTGAANSKSFLFLHPPMAHPSCIGISGDSAKPSAFPMTWGMKYIAGAPSSKTVIISEIITTIIVQIAYLKSRVLESVTNFLPEERRMGI